MDHEKYPNYFIAVMVLYAIVLLVGLSYFIIPSLGFASGYMDFYLILVLFALPLVLFAVYETRNFEFLWGKESLLRTIITAVVIVDFIFDLYMMVLLI